jgi:hypothetical protein
VHLCSDLKAAAVIGSDYRPILGVVDQHRTWRPKSGDNNIPPPQEPGGTMQMRDDMALGPIRYCFLSHDFGNRWHTRPIAFRYDTIPACGVPNARRKCMGSCRSVRLGKSAPRFGAFCKGRGLSRSVFCQPHEHVMGLDQHGTQGPWLGIPPFSTRGFSNDNIIWAYGAEIC